MKSQLAFELFLLALHVLMGAACLLHENLVAGAIFYVVAGMWLSSALDSLSKKPTS